MGALGYRSPLSGGPSEVGTGRKLRGGAVPAAGMEGTTGDLPGTKPEARPNDRLLCRCHCGQVMMKNLSRCTPGDQQDTGPLGTVGGNGGVKCQTQFPPSGGKI